MYEASKDGILESKEFEKWCSKHYTKILNWFNDVLDYENEKLIEAGIKELKLMNFDKMVIGCLEGNPSNNFYKHIGGKFIKTRIFENLQLLENVYYFEKI